MTVLSEQTLPSTGLKDRPHNEERPERPGTPLWKQWNELQNVLEARGLGHLVGKDS